MTITAPRDDLGFVATRRLVDGPVDVTIALAPGDRPLVEAGESVVAGAPVAERLRDPQLSEVPDTVTLAPAPGARVPDGELLFDWRGRWRVAGGTLTEPLETPIAGIIRSVRPGTAIVIRATGRSLPGIVALGGPTRGRLHVAASSDSEVRVGGLDVGLAGTILVVGSRIDAETLTRSRAMGIHGVVVAGLASKERRDYLMSEQRQRAALHRLPPYAVLVLDGAVRRPLSSPVLGILHALAGHEVAIVSDPPAMLFDVPDLELPIPQPDHVRIRGGELAGSEGTWAGLAGPRRFPGGVHLEAGMVRLPDGTTVAVPIGDLERFV
jgi:hypothetical protein